MRAFRIADRRFPIFDGSGARLAGGRWNSPGNSVIYASETYAGAVLEILIHANIGRLPSKHVFIEIDVPDDISSERIASADVPGWERPEFRASRRYGDEWLRKRRTAVLIVPSLVTRGREHNVLINPQHGDFQRIRASAPQFVHWDDRLFRLSRGVSA